MTIDIRPLRIPARLDGTRSELDDLVDLQRAVDREVWGHDHFSYDAAELHVRYRDDRYRGRAAIGAWDGARLVGAAELAWEQQPEARMAEMTLAVLPGHRRRGVGSALLAAAERTAAGAGRPRLVGWSDHAGAELRVGGEVMRAPDGDAGLAAALPTARFAARHGYELQQIERVSGLPVAGRGDALRADLAQRADAASVAGYRLETWTGATPERLVDAYAAARARMALDAPAGGLTIDEEPWDSGRVRAYEGERDASGTVLLVAAAVTGDGAVAGYTELELPAGRPIAYQADTLVVGAHRGHGLGMLVKLANLVRLAESAPERTDVYTWNADENEHMLAINFALGFELRGLAASWQRPES
ncbi:GNAT family N-acetyltransferase [Agromyces sp. ZXT2-6]|uniref:GNAT family N-acetyltransferase n=1 Tax=Agromyces sp. ZXT2-6 TaxID=3461153 RepID=UPI0040551220